MLVSFKEKFPVLALAMGDPNGIGADVMLRALDHLFPIKAWQPLIFGDLHYNSFPLVCKSMIESIDIDTKDDWKIAKKLTNIKFN